MTESQKSDRTADMRIKITRNGPYIVTGGVPLSKFQYDYDSKGAPCDWVKVEDYPLKQTYSLCRCGQFKNMPFCDGTHTKINFNGEEQVGKNLFPIRRRKFEGPELDLIDIPVCMGAGFCNEAQGIWEMVENPDSPECRTDAVRLADNCPSGRLTVYTKEGECLEPEYEPSIVVIEDPETGVIGPLRVRGGIQIEASDGHLYEIHNKITLCCCGKSGLKPRCDGSHKLGK